MTHPTYRTKRCVGCLRTAIKSWTGHVFHERLQRSVLAAWCSRCRTRHHVQVVLVDLLGRRGCYGPYSPRYGMVRDDA
jgi:hypothetical protein